MKDQILSSPSCSRLQQTKRTPMLGSLNRVLLLTFSVVVFFASSVAGLTTCQDYWKPSIQSVWNKNNDHPPINIRKRTELQVLPNPLPALFSGSIAGAVGVGVAYPLDTIKTRAQVIATEQPDHAFSMTPTNIVSDKASRASGGAVALLPPPSGNSMAEVACYIFQTEGVAGFFGGVQTSMAGQAIIKAVVFAINSYMIEYFQVMNMLGGDKNLQLLSAAATAGFVTSFLAAPVDRIKVLMQAGGNTYQGRDDHALRAVLKTEGWRGLLGRGLGCTMLREVPAYSLYFGVYGALMNIAHLTEQLGGAAPLVCGAAAGCACWIPIYPIDVVKTVIQNTEGYGDASLVNASLDQEDFETSRRTEEPSNSLLQVASELYKGHGIGVFWDGLAPRLLRQAVNHATTFGLYEILVHDVFSTM